MLVKEIMSKDVVCATSEMKLKEVADIIFSKKIHGIPVVDKNRIVGIITETDFFTKDSNNIFLPTYLEFIENSKMEGPLAENATKDIDQLLNVRAKDIMTEKCLTIFQDMDVAQLVEFFKTSNYKTLPVTDENENLVGVVTRSDIIALLRN